MRRSQFAAALLSVLLVAVSEPLVAGTVSGRVVDVDGKPLGRIGVLVEHMENRNSDKPDDFALRGQTDADGRFSVSLPPSEKQYEVFLVDSDNRVHCLFAHIDSKQENKLDEIKIEKGCKVGGVVKDTNGKPLKDIEVTVWFKARSKCSHSVMVAEGRSGTDGSFEFTDLTAGGYVFQICAPPFALEDVESEVTGDFNYLDIILKEGAKVTGRILDADGKGIKDAGVSIGGMSAKKSLKTRSDAEGNYALAGLSLGDHSLKVSAKGFAVPGNVEVKVECKEAKTYQKDVKLARTGILVLELEVEDVGVKIPRKITASLSLKSENFKEWGHQELHADVKDAKVVFEEVAPGKFDVQINNDDAARLQQEVLIESGKETKLKFILSKIYELSGKIVDDEGKPVKDATVYFEQPREKGVAAGGGAVFSLPIYAHSRDDGSFFVKNLKTGTYDIRVQQEGFAKFSRQIAVGAEPSQPLTIALSKGKSIAGMVLEADGTPARNLEVTLSNTPGKDVEYVHKQVKVSGDGTFKVDGLPDGAFNISIKDCVFNYQVASVEKVEAGTDDTIITLGKAHAITGVVEEGSGALVENAVVTVEIKTGSRRYNFSRPGDSAKIMSDKEGNFKLSLREGLKYTLRFSHPAYLPTSMGFDVAAGKDSLRVVMEKGISINGTVVKEKENSPVEGVVVKIGGLRDFLFSPRQGQDVQDEKGKTDGSGKFVLDGVSAGMVTFSVLSKDGKPIFSKSMMIKKEQNTPVVIALPEMVSAKGKVLDADGKPLAGAMVNFVSGDNFEARHNASADENGAFEVVNLLPCNYMVYFFVVNRDPGAKMEMPSPQVVEVKAGGVDGVVLRLKGKGGGGEKTPGSLKINGKAVHGGKIRFVPSVGDKMDTMEMMTLLRSVAEADIGSDGTFSVESLKPGGYVFSVSGDGAGVDGGKLSGRVEVKEGMASLEVDIAGTTISGSICSPDGKPVNAAVRLKPEMEGTNKIQQELLSMSTVAKGGKFSFDCVPGGKYTIAVTDEEHGLFSKQVVVGSEPLSVDVKLSAGFKLTGKIAVPEGSSQGGVDMTMVFAMSKEGEALAFGNCGDDGSYEMRPRLGKREYTVYAFKNGCAVEAAPITMERDAVLDFTLVPGGDLVLTLKSDKIPVKDRRVVLKDEAGKEVVRFPNSGEMSLIQLFKGVVNIPTDGKGKTLFSGLKPGTYAISVDGCKVSPCAAEIKALEKMSLELTLTQE